MKNFVTVVIITSLFTSVSALIMTGPRVYAKMAEDQFLLSAFSWRGQFSILNNDKFESIPKTSIVFQCGAAILVICISSLANSWLPGSHLVVMLGIDSGLDLLHSRHRQLGCFFDPSKVFSLLCIHSVCCSDLDPCGALRVGRILAKQNLNPVIAALITLGIGWVSYLRLRKQGRGSDKTQSEL